ncbi:MAG: tetratricopeptide repeat protein [Candidatus Wallbacteria bacterium]|nr:tetratricopeptide repeat protein [Candidatus Wallbacteria bacterium]
MSVEGAANQGNGPAAAILRPGPPRSLIGLYCVAVAVTISANICSLLHGHAPEIPPELRADYSPPPMEHLTPPWEYTSAGQLWDQKFLDDLGDRIEKRHNQRQSRFQTYSAEPLLATGKADEAIARLRKAIALDPRNLEAREKLVSALCFLERWSAARTALDMLRSAGGDLKNPDPRLLAAKPLPPEDEAIGE